MKKDHLDGNKVNEIPIKCLFCAFFFQFWDLYLSTTIIRKHLKKLSLKFNGKKSKKIFDSLLQKKTGKIFIYGETFFKPLNINKLKKKCM